MEKKRSRAVLPWHTKGISGLRENRLQLLLLPKPKEEMFTTRRTLYITSLPEKKKKGPENDFKLLKRKTKTAESLASFRHDIRSERSVVTLKGAV